MFVCDFKTLFRIVVAISAFIAVPIFGAAAGSRDINYSWAGKRLSGAYWGIAFGDVDGDASKEALVLSRGAVKIGKMTENGFDENASCSLPGRAEGARIYAIDLDGDGRDEIVVSAVEEGLPSSLGLKFKKDACEVLFERSRFSVRVAPSAEGRDILMGQAWSSDSFFFGPVFELKLEGRKLKESARVEIKKGAKLFQFAWVPCADGGERSIVMVKGYNPMEFYEQNGKKFKRVWRAGERFGGTVNLLTAEQRDVLGEVDSEFVRFDVPPLVRKWDGGFEVIALRHILPIKNVIGLRPAVSGAEVAIFEPDPAIILREKFRSQKLPGAIADIAFGEFTGGRQALFVLMQNDPSMFRESEGTTILAFYMW